MRFQGALHRSESLPALSATLLGGLSARVAGPQGNPGLSNHNSGPIAMHTFHISHAAKGRPNALPTAVVRPFLGHNALFYSSLTRSSDHGRRGVDSARSG